MSSLPDDPRKARRAQLTAAIKRGSKKASLAAIASLSPDEFGDYETQLAIVRAMERSKPAIVECLTPKLNLDFLIRATNLRGPGLPKTMASNLVHDEIMRRAATNDDLFDSITHPEVHAELAAMMMRETFEGSRTTGTAEQEARRSTRDVLV